ncbi:MAG: ComEC/Rec2 family competence protein [Acidimicrobiales bacterium]
MTGDHAPSPAAVVAVPAAPAEHRQATVAGRSPIVPAAPDVRGRPLTDAGAVVLAVAVVLGAWWAHPLPVVVGLALVAAAYVVNRPSILILAGLILASGLGARAMSGLAPPTPATYRGPATLVSDPEPMAFGTRADVRIGHRRYELWTGGSATGSMARALAGERVVVGGRIGPSRPGSDWLVPRHVVGRFEATRVDPLDGGAGPWRAANRFRRLLGRGAEVLPEPAGSLYGGFVLGDDRGQPPEIVDDFRGSGLTHLLVVSGQNVAFVLVLTRPLTSRLGLTGRWTATVAVIAAFAVITRFEPSVLRASAMAALAATASLAGRPASTMRTLALAVAALVLLDPLLVLSVGFQLSVGASLGIALGAGPIARHIPGPAVLGEALGVTLAAQLGVAPVLVPRFGGLPVVAIVANLLAVPVAGLVTTWGLPAGVVAGLGGPAVAHVVHLPTRAFVAWVATVARVSAGLPFGDIGPLALCVLVGCGLLVAVLGRRCPEAKAARRAVSVIAVTVLALPMVGLARPPPQSHVADGTTLYRAGGGTVLVLDGRVDVGDLMAGLRRAGTGRIDLVIGRADVDLVNALRHRWPVGVVVDPATAPSNLLLVGGLVVDLRGPPTATVAVAVGGRVPR